MAEDRRKEINDEFKFYFRKDIDYFLDEVLNFDIIKFREHLKLSYRQFPFQYIEKRYGINALNVFKEALYNRKIRRRLDDNKKHDKHRVRRINVSSKREIG